MSKFKVGDRVVVRSSYCGIKRLWGKQGKIVYQNIKGWYGVEFDDYVYGHDANGYGQKGHCLNMGEACLVLKNESNKSIHITVDGDKVIAVLKDGKEVVKRAEAKCSPEDTFDFNIGAKLAFERLLGVSVEVTEPKTEQVKSNNTQVKEVKRPAKKGEYIKLVKPVYPFDKVGTILKVSEIRDGWTWATVKVEACMQKSWFFGSLIYAPSEYVVLENYKPEEKKERDTNFKVGDRVRFRSWEDMEKEYGLTKGHIDCKVCFSQYMKHLCGTYATIEKIEGEEVTLKDFSSKGYTQWHYTADMLEKASTK